METNRRKRIRSSIVGPLIAVLFGAMSVLAPASATADANPRSTSGPVAGGQSAPIKHGDRSAGASARASTSHGRRRSGRRRCPAGYKRIRVGRRRRTVCRRRASASPPAAPAEPQPAESGVDLSQQIADDTFELAQKFGEEVIHSNFGGLPNTYQYLIRPEDCATISADTGRCLVYLWTQEYGSGYGYGGYDVGIYRDYFFATRVGDRLYSTKVVMIDFVDPYTWVCSDTPHNETPRCT